MANLRTAGFRKVTPTLKVSDLRGAEGTIVTIRNVEIVPNPNPGRNQRKQLLEIRWTEWPDRVTYPNATGISDLMAKLGDESNAWIGARVPLIVEPANNPQTDEEVLALHIAPASQWEALLEEADADAPRSDAETKRRARRAK